MKKTLITIAIVLLAIIGVKYVQAATLPTAIQNTFETYLSNQQGVNDTTLSLATNALRDGSLLSGYVCVVVDANTPSQENECGTASSTSIINLTRGIDSFSGTTSVNALIFSHRRGADVKVSDYPILTLLTRINNGLDSFPNKLYYVASSSISISNDADIVDKFYVDGGFVSTSTNQSIGGNKTFTGTITFNNPPVSATDPSASNQLANKDYVDGVAIAGAPIATNVVSGIVRIASSTQYASGFASTTSFALSSKFASSTASTTSAIVVVSSSTTGKIDPTFLPSNPASYIDTGHLTSNTVSRFSSDTAGSQDPSSGTNLFVEYPGQVSQSRAVTSDWASAAEIHGESIVGQFIYALLRDNSTTFRLYRYTESNLAAGGTLMTFPGAGLSTSTNSQNMSLTSDGSSLYLNYSSGSSTNDYIISKYTVSGTNLTFVSNTTCGSTGNSMLGFIVDATGNFYGLSSSDQKVRKFNSSGTLQSTSVAYGNESSNAIANIAGSFYIGQLTSSAQAGYALFYQ